MKYYLKDYNSRKINLGKIRGREVLADFNGGKITSDAGIILIAELDKKLKITEKFAKCFQDYRHSSYRNYSLIRLLAQRLYSIILGYEDVNDHDKIRHDPALQVALEKLCVFEPKSSDTLAGKSTINRLEYCPKNIIDQKSSRYHKIEHSPKKIEKTFIDFFLESFKKPPLNIIIDLDVTDDLVHGNQEGAFFNKYYNSVCYAPLYIFCGHHLLAAKLRPSNIDPAAGALEELQRIIPLIRKKWSETHITIRADSAYCREEIMNYCEKQDNVDYAIAMSTNTQLKLRANDIIAKAKADYEAQLEPVIELMETLFSKEEELDEVAELIPNSTYFRSIRYKTEKSWSCERRVVTKVVYGNKGLKIRHVVTSISAKKISPSLLYIEKYCPRGDMENRIKEQQLDLLADWTSTQTFASNQLRLWLSSMAYVLLQAFRQYCLNKTEFETSTVGTIRLNLLKLGARITISCRRILIAIASYCPYQNVLAIANSRIQAIPDT